LSDERKLGSIERLASAFDHFTADQPLPDDKVQRECTIVHFQEKIARRLVDNGDET